MCFTLEVEASSFSQKREKACISITFSRKSLFGKEQSGSVFYGAFTPSNLSVSEGY